MTKSKRLIALILSLLVCSSILAACGGGGNSSDSPAASPAASTGSSGSSEAPASPAIPEPSIPGSAPTNTSEIMAPAPTAEEVKYASHLDIIIDDNRIGLLNPFMPGANNGPTNWTFILMYDRLVRYNHFTDEFEPMLAKSWETDDYQTFTFNLRDDVYFHNGDKFTAQDVLNTAAAAQAGVGSTAYDQWRLVNIEKSSVISDYQLEIVLDSVYVDFIFNIAMPMSGIICKRAMDEDPETGVYIGTGAYSVTNFIPNDVVELKRNDNYWSDPPITETLALRFIPETSTRTMMMQNGEAQVNFGTGVEEVYLFLEDSEHFNVHVITVNNPQCLVFNMELPLSSDYNFRMAVASAIQRDEIAVVSSGDWATPEWTGTLYGYATEFRNNDIPIIPYDLEAAQAYLDASPYNGEPIEFATSNITNVKVGQVLQQQLAKIGIDLWINEFDSAGLAAYRNSPDFKAELQFSPCFFGTSAASFRANFYPGLSGNLARYSNPTLTEMIDEALLITDIDARREHYRKMQELVAEDPPYLSFFYRNNTIVAPKSVGGMHLPDDHMHTDLRYVYMIVD